MEDQLRRRIRELEATADASCASVSISSCCVDLEPSLQDGRQFDFEATIRMPDGGYTKAKSLTDTGASAAGFINSVFVRRNKIPMVKLSKPINLRLADDKLAPQITHMAQVNFRLGNHTDELWCLVTTLGKFDLILGMPWLEQHEPRVRFKERSLTFNSDHCMSYCLQHQKSVTVYSISRPHAPKSADALRRNQHDISEVSAYSFVKLAEKTDNQVIAMWPEHFEHLNQPKEDMVMRTSAFTTDVAAIAADDYDKFFSKMNKLPVTRSELERLVPKDYHAFLDVWNPIEANKLPPHRLVDHRIDLQEGSTPVAKKAYGLSRDQAAVVKGYIDEMLGKQYIRPSTSPYAAPVLIVKKPDGGLRVCVDYRALNALTIKNRNAPPLIRETLSRLCSAKIYSKFDIIAAFNEIRIKEGDEHKTAFLTRYGLFEYVVMPFGLCNAPGTFQAFINETLREHLDVFCTAYVDDILIYSNSHAEHTLHVKKILQALQKAGLYLDIKKCEFHVTQVKYLGLIITTDGLRMDPKKVETVQQWQTPRCIKDVQSFLGFANFYRRFVAGYSRIAAPLTALTRGNQKEFAFPWTEGSAEQQAFQTLKLAFTTAPILAHFDPDREAWLETDASDYVVAAVLSQKDTQGILRPVAFMSKKMSPQECNYEIYDKELLAIIRAFEEWHPELAGTPVEDPIRVITDHKNLEYFMTTKQLNRRQARWAEFLSEFNFRITYRPGRLGTKPDSLTRRPGDLPEEHGDARHQFQHQTIIRDYNLSRGMRPALQLAAILLDELEYKVSHLAALIYDLSEGGSGGEEPIEESSSDTPEGRPPEEELIEESSDGPPTTGPDIMQRVRAAYENDDIVQRIIQAKQAGERKIPFDITQKEHIKLELGECTIHEDLLYVGERLYVPQTEDQTLRTEVLKEIHESPPGGHAGRTSTYDRLSRYYYWPRMTDSVSRYVKSCHVCKRSKSYREGKQGLLKPLPIPERYWTDISVDFITPLPYCTRYGRKYQHIMVVVDRLSKKKKFIPLDSLEVEAVVQAFVEWIWREEGYPKTVVSDRGTQFTSHFWRRLCTRIGTKPKMSTSFHPETDGQTESANAALKQYLRAYVNYDQDNWVDFLPIAEFEANSDRNDSSGLAPFLATKGYLPRSGLEPPTPWDKEATAPARTELRAADGFIEKIEGIRTHLREQLKWAQALQAEQANRNRHAAPELKEGDMVMLDARNIKTTRPAKSLDHKNLGPFKVIRAINNMAYELDLPESMKGLFPVFHPWLLHLDNSDPLPGQVEPPPPPITVDAETETGEYYAEEILDSKMDKRRKDPLTGKKGCLMYKIRYSGYDSYNTTPEWQVWSDAAGSPDLVADFHHKHGDEKPGPHESFKAPEDWTPLLSMLISSTED